MTGVEKANTKFGKRISKRKPTPNTDLNAFIYKTIASLIKTIQFYTEKFIFSDQLLPYAISIHSDPLKIKVMLLLTVKFLVAPPSLGTAPPFAVSS